MSVRIPGLGTEAVQVGELALQVASGGDGPPLLLLHGFPQTHLCWRGVAPVLADRFHVVCPDLPGYGASDKPADEAGHERYSKRATAATMVDLMRQLGHERFSIVGHDRGALVAFRAALDHPTAIENLCTLGVIPGVDMWEALTGVAGVFAFHLYLLAHPSDLPERVIRADPDAFFGHFLDSWLTDPTAIDDDVREVYLSAARTPETIHAVCEDYRAGAFVDPAHDTADRDVGRRIAVPTLAIWEDPGDTPLPFDPKAVWQSWTSDLRTLVLPGGHFLPEERPHEVAIAIEDLISRPDGGTVD